MLSSDMSLQERGPLRQLLKRIEPSAAPGNSESSPCTSFWSGTGQLLRQASSKNTARSTYTRPHDVMIIGSQTEGFVNLRARLLGTSKRPYGMKKIVRHLSKLVRYTEETLYRLECKVHVVLAGAEAEISLETLEFGIAEVRTIHEGNQVEKRQNGQYPPINPAKQLPLPLCIKSC